MIMKELTLDSFRNLRVCGLQMSLEVGSIPSLDDLRTVPAAAAENFFILLIFSGENFEFLPNWCTLKTRWIQTLGSLFLSLNFPLRRHLYTWRLPLVQASVADQLEGVEWVAVEVGQLVLDVGSHRAPQAWAARGPCWCW